MTLRRVMWRAQQARLLDLARSRGHPSDDALERAACPRQFAVLNDLIGSFLWRQLRMIRFVLCCCLNAGDAELTLDVMNWFRLRRNGAPPVRCCFIGFILRGDRFCFWIWFSFLERRK
jgi:hypothetical protein